MLILRANSYLKALCYMPCLNFPLFITVTWKSVFSCGQDMGSGEADEQPDESTRKEGGRMRMHVPFRTGGSPPVCRVSRPFSSGSGPGRLSPGSCMRKAAGTKRDRGRTGGGRRRTLLGSSHCRPGTWSCDQSCASAVWSVSMDSSL